MQMGHIDFQCIFVQINTTSTIRTFFQSSPRAGSGMVAHYLQNEHPRILRLALQARSAVSNCHYLQSSFLRTLQQRQAYTIFGSCS